MSKIADDFEAELEKADADSLRPPGCPRDLEAGERWDSIMGTIYRVKPGVQNNKDDAKRGGYSKGVAVDAGGQADGTVAVSPGVGRAAMADKYLDDFCQLVAKVRTGVTDLTLGGAWARTVGCDQGAVTTRQCQNRGQKLAKRPDVRERCRRLTRDLWLSELKQWGPDAFPPKQARKWRKFTEPCRQALLKEAAESGANVIKEAHKGGMTQGASAKLRARARVTEAANTTTASPIAEPDGTARMADLEDIKMALSRAILSPVVDATAVSSARELLKIIGEETRITGSQIDPAALAEHLTRWGGLESGQLLSELENGLELLLLRFCAVLKMSPPTLAGHLLALPDEVPGIEPHLPEDEGVTPIAYEEEAQ